MSLWSQQIKHLVLKNLLISWRNKLSTIFQFVSPFLVCFIILGLQYLAEDFNDISVINPPSKNIPFRLNRCSKPTDCISIGIGVYGKANRWVNYTVDKLKEINNFTDKDVVLQYEGMNFTDYNTYFLNNKNKTMMAVYFCTDVFCSHGQLLGFNASQLYTYNIIYNKTMIPTAAFQGVD